ncbi:MAG: hypothetical protein ACPLXC_01035 [Candidatus Pacearchaeota archaeon]
MLLDKILQKKIDRREFLKILGLGTIGLLAKPLMTFGQNYGYKGKGDIETRMNDALKLKGEKICGYTLPFDDSSELNVRMEYICGPRGGSGKLRALAYLGEDDWKNSKGLDQVIFWFFSIDETEISKKVYEVNLDKVKNEAIYSSAAEVMHEVDYIIEELKGKGYAMLKVLKIDKKDVEEFLRLKGIVDRISEYQLRRTITEMGNTIAGDHVWPNEVEYHGYGVFDIDIFMDKKVRRAPKLVEFEISRGESSIVGWALKAISRDYKVHARGNDRINSKAVYCAPLDMRTLTGN